MFQCSGFVAVEFIRVFGFRPYQQPYLQGFHWYDMPARDALERLLAISFAASSTWCQVLKCGLVMERTGTAHTDRPGKVLYPVRVCQPCRGAYRPSED